MKLRYFGIGLLIFLLLITSVYATSKVALIVKDKSSLSEKHEKKIHQTLTKMGFDVVPIDKNSVGVNYSDYVLIVIAGRPTDVYPSEHLDSFVVNIPVNDIPTIAIDSVYPDDWGWIKPGGMSTVSSTDVQKIVVVDDTHPITKGRYAGEIVTVHTVIGKTILDLIENKTKLTPIANLIGTDNPVIAVAEPSTTLYGDKILNTRIVFFGITYSIYWTDSAEDLFKKSVEWLLEDNDEDGIIDALDNCPGVYNPNQLDTDSDGLGNVCDEDDDNDSVPDISDFCSLEDATGYDNYIGRGTSTPGRDGCIDDVDSDNIKDNMDNCVGFYNPSQSDVDLDGVGNACDACPSDPDNDIDKDEICGDVDNCPFKYNPDQADEDGDGIGNVCEILPYQVFLDVDSDEVNETAINENNITDDGFELYDDPDRNSKAISMDADFDGMTDWLIDVFPYGWYEKYWDPDDEILTDVIRANNDYYIDTDGDNTTDIVYNSNYDAFILRFDVDSDSNLELALDTNKDGSYDDYRDSDWSSKLLYIVDGDEDGKNDFIIGMGADPNKPAKYWDPDDEVLTSITEANVDNNGVVEYTIDIDGDNTYDKVYDVVLYDFPDLVVKSISISPSSPSPGEDVDITATIKNVGGYNAFNFTVELTVNGTLKNKTISLSRGDSIDLTFDWNDVSEGSHTIKIIVDSTDVILESNEENNEKTKSISISPPPSGVGGGVGGPVFKPTGTAKLTGFPKKAEVDVGDSVTVSGKFESTFNYDLNNLEFTIKAEGLNPDWYTITPRRYSRIVENDSKDVSIKFNIPADAEIYTYSVTLKASADSRIGKRTFYETFNLMLKEKIEITTTTTIPTTTTTTIPPKEEISPLTGLYLFVKSYPLPIAIIIIVIIILIVLKVLKVRFEFVESKGQYVYGKGWLNLMRRFKFFTTQCLKNLLTKW